MEKDLNYWKKNAEEDYMKVPISVLRYITELEKVVLPQADVSGSSAVNRCNECSKELEGGTVFCSVDCRQHYYH